MENKFCCLVHVQEIQKDEQHDNNTICGQEIQKDKQLNNTVCDQEIDERDKITDVNQSNDFSVCILILFNNI